MVGLAIQSCNRFTFWACSALTAAARRGRSGVVAALAVASPSASSASAVVKMRIESPLLILRRGLPVRCALSSGLDATPQQSTGSPMRYFLDTEYNGTGGELMSLALVPEDGEELYL